MKEMKGGSISNQLDCGVSKGTGDKQQHNLLKRSEIGFPLFLS